ncbi:MAG: hypothetical protein EXR60_06950 [Dehalococcoidia bacterium]|nr:hypothetical protein [Dehalococcoidia bacterium]
MTTESAQDFIDKKSQQKLPIYFKTVDIGRQGKYRWVIEARTFRVQTNYPEKVFVIERLRLFGFEGTVWRPREMVEDKGDIEYRLGYFIKARNGKVAGKWVWGQYCPLVPAPDFWPLMEQAVAEGTIRPKGTFEPPSLQH